MKSKGATTIRATAIACANIAFIKYWGDADPALHLPANSSLSLTLDGLTVTATVEFREGWPDDTLEINGEPAIAAATERVSALLEQIRRRAGIVRRARVATAAAFPAGAGLASSAAAFAALAVAGCAAAGLSLSEPALSALARLGSGSACRSVPAGYVLWTAAERHEDSFARSIAPPEHWELCDCIAIVDTTEKQVSSAVGHLRAPSSPLHRNRVLGTPARLAGCLAAIQARDLAGLGRLAEADALLMHAVAMSATPPAFYWSAATLAVMRAVVGWREQGLNAWYTIDAGPNVHCLCQAADAPALAARLRELPEVRAVRVACPGPGAHLIEQHLF